jgi:hypothetical protein
VHITGNKLVTYLAYNTFNINRKGVKVQLLNELIVDENNIALHPMMGNSFQLNVVGSEVLKLLQEHESKEGVIKYLHQKYGVSEESLFIDVSDFMAKLKIYGLVQ